MLEAGARIPADVRVWFAPREGPRPLSEALADGRVLLVFYLLDWSFT